MIINVWMTAENTSCFQCQLIVMQETLVYLTDLGIVWQKFVKGLNREFWYLPQMRPEIIASSKKVTENNSSYGHSFHNSGFFKKKSFF